MMCRRRLNRRAHRLQGKLTNRAPNAPVLFYHSPSHPTPPALTSHCWPCTTATPIQNPPFCYWETNLAHHQVGHARQCQGCARPAASHFPEIKCPNLIFVRPSIQATKKVTQHSHRIKALIILFFSSMGVLRMSHFCSPFGSGGVRQQTEESHHPRLESPASRHKHCGDAFAIIK